MGEPPRDLAWLAARTNRLARQIPNSAVGLRRNRPPPLARRARLSLGANRAAEFKVRAMLKKCGANLAAVDFFRVPTDRGWMRDSGPIAVQQRRRRSLVYTLAV